MGFVDRRENGFRFVLSAFESTFFIWWRPKISPLKLMGRLWFLTGHWFAEHGVLLYLVLLGCVKRISQVLSLKATTRSENSSHQSPVGWKLQISSSLQGGFININSSGACLFQCMACPRDDMTWSLIMLRTMPWSILVSYRSNHWCYRASTHTVCTYSNLIWTKIDINPIHSAFV